MSSLFRARRRAQRDGAALLPMPAVREPIPDQRTTVGPAVDECPGGDVLLVERMRLVRPGLTEEQALAGLEALRTLGVVMEA